ncbi:aspartate ammonia-lyase [Microaceticoccus formicicus]|uniref:aspartate ammonia-lyase n=1 Tax=Microaceticoccus formicicus TaxID=3118105 RepID=UPI003CD018AD|nr:aspartate ammonia-lyase [Peptoniphilaceae bacterium AMB_02]
MVEFRLETDSIGEKEVPQDAYYGVQSLRGNENFHITGELLHKKMIKALAIVKKACAISNFKAKVMDKEVMEAIVQACDEVIDGELDHAFIVDPIQGGAGTTANMNANEVIANRANQIMGGGLGTYEFVHPNDHVNMGQSTNDVYPTAGKIGTLLLLPRLLKEMNLLYEDLMKKSKEFDSVLKMGRTQLQDAVPIRLGQEFHAYASVIKRDIARIEHASNAIKSINMGASAIGTGINVDTYYFNIIVPTINDLSGLELNQSEDLVDGTHNLDGLVEVSSALKILAVNLSKISNDLRLMSSGPKTMVGDINLPPRQNGSSIMPGKVNPVIPEVVSQVAFRVIGNDVTITMAAEGGQLELNAFEPVLFYSLYQSIEFLERAIKTLRVNCITGITANEEKMLADVHNSTGIITALVPHIGYAHAARIAKKALKDGIQIRTLIEEENLLTKEELDEILNPLAMTSPGIPAKHLLENKK